MKVTYEDLKAIAPRFRGKNGVKQNEICRETAAAIGPMLDEFKVNTPLRVSHFLSQLCHESAGFRTTREFASGAAYEGRKDLGNTRKGDGKRFRGRGLIQVTGRANYTTFTRWMKRRRKDAPSFVANPQELEKFPWALYSAFWYWSSRRLNGPADRDDLRRVTKIINGGYNGLEDRRNKLKKAKRRFAGEGGEDQQPDAYANMLKKGSRGEKVRKYQAMLVELGFHVEVDGIYGNATKAQTEYLQKSLGLTIDGIAGPDTLTAAAEALAKQKTHAKRMAEVAQEQEAKALASSRKAREVAADVAAEGRVSTEKPVAAVGGLLATTAAAKEVADNVGGSIASFADYVPDWFIPTALIVGAAGFGWHWYRRNQKQRKAKAALLDNQGVAHGYDK